jgi:capsule biosynthesis phosphatase
VNRLIVDLDGTLTIDDPSVSYADRRPRLDVISRLHHYRERGFVICVMTARNMRTFEGNVGLINAKTLPIIQAWLVEHHVPFDEIIVGKPWCGPDGFYVDDRCLRPDEFVNMSNEEIAGCLAPSPTN